jgi:hypothetical protein
MKKFPKLSKKALMVGGVIVVVVAVYAMYGMTEGFAGAGSAGQTTSNVAAAQAGSKSPNLASCKLNTNCASGRCIGVTSPGGYSIGNICAAPGVSVASAYTAWAKTNPAKAADITAQCPPTFVQTLANGMGLRSGGCGKGDASANLSSANKDLDNSEKNYAVDVARIESYERSVAETNRVIAKLQELLNAATVEYNNKMARGGSGKHDPLLTNNLVDQSKVVVNVLTSSIETLNKHVKNLTDMITTIQGREANEIKAQKDMLTTVGANLKDATNVSAGKWAGSWKYSNY